MLHSETVPRLTHLTHVAFWYCTQTTTFHSCCRLCVVPQQPISLILQALLYVVHHLTQFHSCCILYIVPHDDDDDYFYSAWFQLIHFTWHVAFWYIVNQLPHITKMLHSLYCIICSILYPALTILLMMYLDVVCYQPYVVTWKNCDGCGQKHHCQLQTQPGGGEVWHGRGSLWTSRQWEWGDKNLQGQWQCYRLWVRLRSNLDLFLLLFFAVPDLTALKLNVLASLN